MVLGLMDFLLGGKKKKLSKSGQVAMPSNQPLGGAGIQPA